MVHSFVVFFWLFAARAAGVALLCVAISGCLALRVTLQFLSVWVIAMGGLICF